MLFQIWSILESASSQAVQLFLSAPLKFKIVTHPLEAGKSELSHTSGTRHNSLTASAGGGVLWRQWVEENSGAGIKTRDGHAFALKGYSSLFLLTGAVRAARSLPVGARGQPNNNNTKREALQTHSRHGVHRNVPQRWQQPLIEVDNNTDIRIQYNAQPEEQQGKEKQTH